MMMYNDDVCYGEARPQVMILQMLMGCNGDDMERHGLKYMNLQMMMYIDSVYGGTASST